ncbi:hypothetical protein RF11_10164 [Thelohanellus kitauei]|uniref:Tc1-like transposase DDE domain-containing protein n=1 Tax=Thelohanellus kitauei TaxID=669202 RepID=A0A0C2JA95_THEKT|nr:hypothetical protein RF11_10164 [Thelohanellus kitauei]
MDNVLFHHSTEVCEVVKTQRHQTSFIPQYPPQLNPIELLFSKRKSVTKLGGSTSLRKYSLIKDLQSPLRSQKQIKPAESENLHERRPRSHVRLIAESVDSPQDFRNVTPFLIDSTLVLINMACKLSAVFKSDSVTIRSITQVFCDISDTSTAVITKTIHKLLTPDFLCREIFQCENERVISTKQSPLCFGCQALMKLIKKRNAYEDMMSLSESVCSDFNIKLSSQKCFDMLKWLNNKIWILILDGNYLLACQFLHFCDNLMIAKDSK